MLFKNDSCFLLWPPTFYTLLFWDLGRCFPLKITFALNQSFCSKVPQLSSNAFIDKRRSAVCWNMRLPVLCGQLTTSSVQPSELSLTLRLRLQNTKSIKLKVAKIGMKHGLAWAIIILIIIWMSNGLAFNIPDECWIKSHLSNTMS